MTNAASTVSVIICSVDREKFDRVTAQYQRAFRETGIEIIGIPDARSLAQGYNRGIDRARGAILLFSHDDVELLSPDFAARMREHLERYDVLGIAGTRRVMGGGWYFAGDPHDFMLVVSPHPETGQLTLVIEGGGAVVVPHIQALDGVFIAVRAEIARALRFDDVNFDGFHLYDLDFTFRAFQSGFELAVCRDLVLVHHSRGTFDPQWERYRRIFERKHASYIAPLARREPRLLNVPLPRALLDDARYVADLCRPENLARLIAHNLESASPFKPNSLMP